MKTSKYLFFISLMLIADIGFAQCSMCRAVLESNADNSTAEGINDGIVYLMIFPYLLMGGLGYYIYKTYQKQKDKNAQSTS